MGENMNQETIEENLTEIHQETPPVTEQEMAETEKQENTQKAKKEAPKKKSGCLGKAVIVIICILLIIFIVVVFSIAGIFMIYKNKSDKNQLIANEVAAMIDMLDDKEIVPEDEEEILKVKKKYDGLTSKQKKLVSNSKVLDEVINELEDSKKNIDKKLDQEAANEVIRLIETLKGKTITVESESELTVIKMQYETLTQSQKELVSNYNIFEKASKELEQAKDQKIAEELVLAIDSIDEDSLNTDSTEIDKLINQYNTLTENQKNLVTNYYKLGEYQEKIHKNESKEKQIQSGINLANNFPGFSGKWGDFGAHINSYQGMIETVIRRDANLRGHFVCDPDPNYLQMYASRFTKDTSGFGIGRCSVTFTGTSKKYGDIATMYGEVIIKNDGTLYFTMSYIG